ncbi:hypothetical protein F2Q70_00000906 [Brassica cretica]|uniref:Uncharacterized protein n=1 Tax=Brassica cretica TaxID=69181 RepID=A0A8S9IY77_BRACR|nr:hypothetical protein F2Q70_00000906 [Brassica cretica]
MHPHGPSLLHPLLLREVDTGDERDHRYAPRITTTSTTAFGLLLMRLRARERER